MTDLQERFNMLVRTRDNLMLLMQMDEFVTFTENITLSAIIGRVTEAIEELEADYHNLAV